MQDEWQERFKDKLNDELKQEGVIADNRLIQKTLLAISEAEQPLKQEAARRAERGNNLGRTHRRRFCWIFAETAAAAAVLCVMVFSLLMFQQGKRNENSAFDIADSIQNELGEPSDGSPETEELENIKGAGSIQNGQAEAGSDNGSDLLQSGQQAAGSEGSSDTVQKEHADSDGESSSNTAQDGVNMTKPEGIQENEKAEDESENKLLSGEWDALTVTLSGGKSIRLPAEETPGSEIILCLQKAELQTETKKTDWTAKTLMYEITVSSEEKNLGLAFYQGGYLLAGEGEEERSAWKLQELKTLEELLEGLAW